MNTMEENMTTPNYKFKFQRVDFWFMSMLVFIGSIMIMIGYCTKDNKNVREKAPIEAVGSNPDCDTNFCYYPYGIKEEMWLRLVDTIKYFEGYAPEAYESDDFWYVGYGHQIKYKKILDMCVIPNENTTTEDWIRRKEVIAPDCPKKVDKYEAEAWLLNDLEIAIKEAYRLTGLTGGKLLCVADFLYQYGEPRFTKYKILDKLKAGYPTLKNDCYYNEKFNERMYQRRLFDLWLYGKEAQNDY